MVSKFAKTSIFSAFADKRGETYEAAFAEFLAWYDSYQFSPEKPVKVINPVSLGNALSSGVLKGYWESTAGSTLIFDALKAESAAGAEKYCNMSPRG